MKGSRVRHRALQAAPDPERSGRRIFSVGPCRSPGSSRWGMSLRTRTAPLRRRRGRSRQPLFAPVALLDRGLCRRGAPSPGPARISERNAGQKESTGGCCRRTFLRRGAGSQIRARCRGSSEAPGPKWQHASGPIHPARDEHGQGTRAGSWLDPASCRKMGTARAVLSHSPTSTVSPT